MDREKILQKAQSKKANAPDEMELQVMQKGSGAALISILVFCVILMIAKMIAKQPWQDVYSIAFISMGAQHLYKGIKLHQKREIALGIAYSVLALLMAVGYIIEILK